MRILTHGFEVDRQRAFPVERTKSSYAVSRAGEQDVELRSRRRFPGNGQFGGSAELDSYSSGGAYRPKIEREGFRVLKRDCCNGTAVKRSENLARELRESRNQGLSRDPVVEKEVDSKMKAAARRKMCAIQMIRPEYEGPRPVS